MKKTTRYTNNMVLIAENGSHGLHIFLLLAGTKRHYLMTLRRNRLLYAFLKDGVVLDELKRIKPQRSKVSQKKYHTCKHLLRVADSFLHELDAT